MKLPEFIELLLPGDPATGAPGYLQACGLSLQEEEPELWDAMQLLLDEWQESHECHDNELSSTVAAQALQTIRERNDECYERFREQLLGRYLSSPIVLSALGESTEPLFPRGQALPAIRVEELEPVYERGPLWRPVTEES